MLITDRGNQMRPWNLDDATCVVTAFADPAMAHQTGSAIGSERAATEWIEHRLAQWHSGEGFSWAVIDDTNRVVGSVSVGAIDVSHSTGWVSYWTRTECRGSGLISSATRALAEWAFDDLDIFRLELGHRTNNPSSCYVALAAGFAVEGLERQKLRYDGHRCDVELHARLATDAFVPSWVG